MTAHRRNSSSISGEVRIVYRADGTATVNGAPVVIRPGQDMRDAAYQAAVALAAASGATGPVVATSIEPDGVAYPVTLYPGRAAPAVAEAGPAGAGAAGALHRVRHAWYRPTLSMGWMAAAACACVLLSVLATVLLHEDGPPIVRLSVDTENDPTRTPAAQSIGHAISTAPGVMSTERIRALAKRGAAAKPSASAAPSASQSTVAAGIGAQPTPGVPLGPQPSPGTIPIGPSQDPGASPSGGTKRVTVTGLTLSMVGGDQSNQNIAYVATVTTSNSEPFTLTYTYSGAGGRAAVTRTVQLSGSTNYVVANLIPSQPYCGGPVTMTVSTSPAAKTGPATATAQPGC
ncbi:hypothetical protein KDK95_14995 [Actinospica sp. MGRD01-02]|uniref:Uncharacterized protein n=1 Tax=Actinospica acidithermotolerans TaxID=2828514 RepID=A0A941IK04_9ACTN|nr:hypothetical protein [Actinospica acidithermotolerans]MBR7827623.1 hypothetical protein [Actinospica acidithermotolerans]